MNTAVDNTPYFALVDDDAHSALLLTRMLVAHGSPRCETFDGPEDAMARMVPSLSSFRAYPTLVIVDLKAHSAASLEFVAGLTPMLGADLPVVVMAHRPNRESSEALLDAGAAAVFTLHAELAAYRREAASIVSFWARQQRLDAVGM